MFAVVVAVTVGTMFVLEMLYGGEKIVEDKDGPTVEEVFSDNASTNLTVSDSAGGMGAEEARLRAAARAAAEGVARDVAREAAEAALNGETYTTNTTSAADDADLEAVARAAAITEARRIAAETAKKVIDDQLG